MKYALVLWPLNNARYEQSQIRPAVSELEIILGAAGIRVNAEYISIGGAGALTFSSEELSERQLGYIRKHSLFFMFGVWDGHTLIILL